MGIRPSQYRYAFEIDSPRITVRDLDRALTLEEARDLREALALAIIEYVNRFGDDS